MQAGRRRIDAAGHRRTEIVHGKEVDSVYEEAGRATESPPRSFLFGSDHRDADLARMSGIGKHPPQEIYRGLLVGAVRHDEYLNVHQCGHLLVLRLWLPGLGAEALDVEDVDTSVVDGNESIPFEFLQYLVQRRPLHPQHGGQCALREFDRAIYGFVEQ